MTSDRDLAQPSPAGEQGESDEVRFSSRTSLSPSRASDFMTCPLLYRFRVLDKLPERASVVAVRGSVVHKVLENLFDLPARDRTYDRASLLLGPAWETMLADDPQLAEIFGADTPDLAEWLDECRELLTRYFALEDPQRLEPAEREVHVATTLDSGLTLHGYVDRLDVASTGEMRVVDYKTGRSPDERFEARALFQMKFYALVLWRTRGVIPSLLQLIYLGNGEVLRYRPDEADLLATERKVEALWAAITRAFESGDWRPNKGPVCEWCDHQSRCPAWGGTLPPLPVALVEETRMADRSLTAGGSGSSVEMTGDLDVAAAPQEDVLPVMELHGHALG
jgi:putative RecB family exonuclease